MRTEVPPPRPQDREGIEGAKGLGPRKTILAGVADWTVARLGLARPVVLVSGFWRSGTTWLQEMLAESIGGKTIFEPLSPLNPRRGEMLQRAGVVNDALREALIPPSAAPNDDVWKYLDRAFFADYSSRFSYACRRSVEESLRHSIVVKDVRMQFNLENVHARYGIPVVHIRRHPGAVISSLIAQDWTWSFDDVSLADLLPDRFDGLQEYDTDRISKISAYWAVTEKIVQDATRGRPWATIVSYEETIAKPAAALSALCAFIGQEQQRVPNFGAPSVSHFRKNNTSPSHARRDGWREKLCGADIDRARYVIKALYPEFVFD